jgi:hypothetical protein
MIAPSPPHRKGPRRGSGDAPMTELLQNARIQKIFLTRGELAHGFVIDFTMRPNFCQPRAAVV